MSRYFTSNQPERPNDSRQTNTSQISLPEFIPFNNEHENKSQKEISIPSPSSSRIPQQQLSQNRQQTRSPSNYFPETRSPDRHRPFQIKENRNSRERRLSREPSHNYDDFAGRNSKNRSWNRSRSRSPSQRRRNESRSRYSPPPPLEDYRERSNQASVFDRMSSPPVPRRKHENLRRSNESNGQNPSHLMRTINSHVNYDEISYQSVDVRYQRDQSPYESNRRDVVEPAPRPVIYDQNVELRQIRERLIDAEKHCLGLESTVRAYEREIHKLRLIVNDLIEDFEVVQARI